MSQRIYRPRYSSYTSYDYAKRHIEKAKELSAKYGDAFEQIRSLFLNLDEQRTGILFEGYKDAYGASAQRYARQTYQKWCNGEVKLAGQTMERLLDLLPRYMTADEKLVLIKHLRQQALKRLHKNNIKLTLTDQSSMDAVIVQVLKMVRCVGEIELPQDFREVQGWMSLNDAKALGSLVQETERYIATQRLADLMVQLAMISRLRVVAASGLTMNVVTTFSITTASVTIDFTKEFWKNEIQIMNNDDANFLVTLQNQALTETHKDGKMTFVDYVMRTMTPEEHERLRQIALSEGIQLDILMQEMSIKTQAARTDIKDIIELAERLKSTGQKAKINSEHATASGVTKIEINNGPCYIATACYGNYEHDDVKLFRRYRDKTLMRSILGRAFVSIYYATSPPLARRLELLPQVSAFIRHFLLEPIARKLGQKERKP